MKLIKFFCTWLIVFITTCGLSVNKVSAQTPDIELQLFMNSFVPPMFDEWDYDTSIVHLRITNNLLTSK